MRSFIFALALLLPNAAFASYGVVDVQKVMEATPEWTTEVSKLKRDWEKKKSELEAHQSELRKQKEALDAKRVVSDPNAVAEEERGLLEQANKFRMALIQAQQVFTRREAALKEAMLSRIERVVYAIAEKGDYEYIFETGTLESPNVLYAKKGLDLTNEVITRYKRAYKDKPLEIPDVSPPATPVPQLSP